jgi:hypothetical protein
LFDHGLEDLVVGFTTGYVGVEIFLHAAGGFAGPGEGATRVIAEAGRIFTATAHTEDAFSERFAARSFLCSCGRGGAHHYDHA